VDLKMLYNLLSNFGNIFKIVYKRNSNKAKVEYENIEYAFIAKKYLDGIIFYGKKLNVIYVK
jgi:RNA recognition motif-containing protein